MSVLQYQKWGRADRAEAYEAVVVARGWCSGWVATTFGHSLGDGVGHLKKSGEDE